MTGREGSVNNKIHLQLFKHARRKKTIEMYSSLDGSDRFLNADGLYSMGKLFFLVEMKSHKSNLKEESRKPNACKLCCRLPNSPEMLNSHNRGHMAAWGQSKSGKLEFKIGVYHDLVCNEDTLKDCDCVEGIVAKNIFLSDDDFFERLDGEIYGLNGAELIEYLKWLLTHGGGVEASSAQEEFPLSLFGASFTGDDYGLEEYHFKTYNSFLEWANKVVSVLDSQAQKAQRATQTPSNTKSATRTTITLEDVPPKNPPKFNK